MKELGYITHDRLMNEYGFKADSKSAENLKPIEFGHCGNCNCNGKVECEKSCPDQCECCWANEIF